MQAFSKFALCLDDRGVGRKRDQNKMKMGAKCDSVLRVFTKSSKEFRRGFKSQTYDDNLGSIRAEKGGLAK